MEFPFREPSMSIITISVWVYLHQDPACHRTDAKNTPFTEVCLKSDILIGSNRNGRYQGGESGMIVREKVQPKTPNLCLSVIQGTFQRTFVSGGRCRSELVLELVDSSFRVSS